MSRRHGPILLKLRQFGHVGSTAHRYPREAPLPPDYLVHHSA
jgi:hypothetical protein